jgi:HK97 family phage prohead protease
MMERGDVSQCSFAFRVEEDKWEYIKGAGEDAKGFWVRTISKVKALYDVSIVTYPAYPDTTVSMRSMPKPDKKEETADTGWHEYINAVRSTL